MDFDIMDLLGEIDVWIWFLILFFVVVFLIKSGVWGALGIFIICFIGYLIYALIFGNGGNQIKIVNVFDKEK